MEQSPLEQVPIQQVPIQQVPIQQVNMQIGDDITKLPVDKNPPSVNEIHIVNSLFTEQNKSIINTILSEGQDAILVGILFILFSLPQIDEILYKFISSTKNSIYILLGVKAILITLLWWVIKYFYLSRKKN
jgi:hypothetical protein